MSDEIIDRYYRVESYEMAVAALEPHDCIADGEMRSTPDTTVVWVGQITDPPPTYDDEGNVLDPGVDCGLHVNVSSRDQSIIDALDADDRLERMHPTTPVSVLA